MKQARTLIGISVMWLALSVLTDGISALVLPAMILNLAAENTRATDLGLITFVGLIAGMMTRPVAFRVSNILRPRWGRKGSIVCGLVLLLAALFLIGSSTALFSIAAGFALAQITTSLVKASQQSFISDLIPIRQRDTARGMKNLMKIGGTTLGFLLLGQLLKQGQAGPALGAIATFLIVGCVIMLLLVREPKKPLPEMSQLTPAELERRDGTLDFRRHHAFLWLIGSRFLFLMGIFGVGRFMLYFLVGALGMDGLQAVEETGFLLAGLAFLTLVFGIPAARAVELFGRMPMMIFGALTSAAGALLLMKVDSTTDVLVYGGLIASGLAFFNSGSWALGNELAPQVEKSRYLGLLHHVGAAAAASAGLFGLLLDGLNLLTNGEKSYQPLFISMAITFAGSAIFILMVQRLMHHPRHAESIS